MEFFCIFYIQINICSNSNAATELISFSIVRILALIVDPSLELFGERAGENDIGLVSWK